MLIACLIDGRLSKTDVSKRERENRVVGATLVETPQTAPEKEQREGEKWRGVVLRYERHFSCQFANY